MSELPFRWILKWQWLFIFSETILNLAPSGGESFPEIGELLALFGGARRSKPLRVNCKRLLASSE